MRKKLPRFFLLLALFYVPACQTAGTQGTRATDATDSSVYPKTYIVPKGVCEESQPAMTIEK